MMKIKNIISNKKGELEPLMEVTRVLPRILIFLALIFFIYGIIDYATTKRPTIASLDFDRITRDINFMNQDEILNSPITTKWYINNKGYYYRFFKQGDNNFHHSVCQDNIKACMCLFGGDAPECKTFENIDFKTDQINIDMSSELKYHIEIKKYDCNEKICFVDLALK